MKIPVKNIMSMTLVLVMTTLPGMINCYAAAAAPQEATQQAVDPVVSFVLAENAKPNKVGNMGTTHWRIEDHTLVWTINLSEETGNAVLDAIPDNNVFKQIFLGSMQNDPTIVSLRDKLVSYNYPLRTVWRYGDRSLSATVSVDELRQMTFSRPSSKFEGMAEVANRACPREVGEGVVMTSCTYSDGRITYRYQMEPLAFKISKIGGSEIMVNEMKGMLDTEVMRTVMHAASADGVELCYQYYNRENPSETITLVIDPVTGDITIE